MKSHTVEINGNRVIDFRDESHPNEEETAMATRHYSIPASDLTEAKTLLREFQKHVNEQGSEELMETMKRIDELIDRIDDHMH